MKSATSTLVISLFLIGFIVCISSIVNIFTHKTVISYPLQFISACLLIICGTLLIARAELIQIRGRIGDRRGFDELDARVSGLESKKERISSWKFSDLEHRVDELEKKVRN